MEFLKVRDAAARLSVSPSTLRAWEQRFGYPQPARSPGGHRLYRHADVAALRDALRRGLSISSAISHLRQAEDTVDVDALAGPLAALDAERAATALERALDLRSLEQTVEDLLLPTLRTLRRQHGADSVAWAFAAAWADDWLRWAGRLALRPRRPIRLLIGDATRATTDLEGLELRALQLHLTRAGADVLTLPVGAAKGVARAVAELRPAAIAVAGRRGASDEVEHWIAAARGAAGPRPLALYRGCDRRLRYTRDAHALPASPLAAARGLLALAATPARVPRALAAAR